WRKRRWEGCAVTAELLALAQAGDEHAFGQLVDPYRRELQVYCYRFLGSVADAEDALQETLLSAWQHLAGFEGRASVRTWLYRVAASRCLDALRSGRRRPPVTAPPAGLEPPEPTRLGELPWLEPYPDELLAGLADSAPGPQARYESRESISLAFITALQLLPPRQRAAIILRDVLGFHASEAARILDTSEESVTSALKRARAALERHQRSSGRKEPARLCRRAAAGRAVHPGVRDSRRGRHHRLAHRGCLADHAAAADGVPGTRAGRPVPHRHGVAARLDRPADTGPGQRPARPRLLRPRPGHGQLLHGR